MKNVQCKNCTEYQNEWCELRVDSPDSEIICDGYPVSCRDTILAWLRSARIS